MGRHHDQAGSGVQLLKGLPQAGCATVDGQLLRIRSGLYGGVGRGLGKECGAQEQGKSCKEIPLHRGPRDFRTEIFLSQPNTVRKIAAARFASSNLAAWEREILLEVELQSELNFARISDGGGDNAKTLAKE